MKSGKLVSLLSLFIFAAGCSDVKLSRDSGIAASSVDAGGSFCSLPNGMNSSVLKTIFVVDMSGSNIALGSSGFSTDRTGDRFKVISDFLSLPCATTNPLNKFAVVGFSKDTFGNTCNKTSLGDVAGARAQLNTLNNIQTNAIGQLPNMPTMNQTYYVQGFNCVQGIVNDDLASLSVADKANTAYMVYFLTDGMPTDFPDIQTTKNTLDPVLTGLMQSGAMAGGLRISPILYGSATLTAAGLSNEVASAQDVLNFIADRGDSFVTNVDQANQIKFCDILNSGARTKYTVKTFGVINMTAVMKNGRLYADSDMDGLLDQDELVRGFDPTKARSGVGGNQLLDGLCPKGMNAMDCRIYTGCGAPNNMGLNSCDISAYGLSDGLDSDKDSIPDLVEIIKGSQPNFDDRFNNVDGDSMDLMDEIAVGRDPFFPDDNAPTNLLVSSSHQMSMTPVAGCSANQESWTFSLDSVPLIHTMSAPGAIVPHAADENVVFIYYMVMKANDSVINPSPAKFFGQFIKVKFGQSGIIQIGVFQKLGDINGQFIPAQ